MAIVRVTRGGRMTIPAKLRKAIGIEPGYTLLLRQVGARQFLVDVLPRRSLDSFPIFQGEVDMAEVCEQMGSALAQGAFRRGHERDTPAR